MNQKIKWIVAGLFAGGALLTGVAQGAERIVTTRTTTIMRSPGSPGFWPWCSYSSNRLEPVGERISEEQPAEPSFGQTVGNIVAAPFRIVGGALMLPAVGFGAAPAPVAERISETTTTVITVPSRVRHHHRHHHHVTHRQMAPVGEHKPC